MYGAAPLSLRGWVSELPLGSLLERRGLRLPPGMDDGWMDGNITFYLSLVVSVAML